jgi:WD40 repeat protein
VWNAATGQNIAILLGHTEGVRDCAFTDDGKLLATVSADRSIRIWDVETLRCESLLRVAHPLSGCTWLPGSRTLCAVGEAGVYVFRYEEGVVVRTSVRPAAAR